MKNKSDDIRFLGTALTSRKLEQFKIQKESDFYTQPINPTGSQNRDIFKYIEHRIAYPLHDCL